MIIWRLVLAKMGTYTEIENHWSFCEIMEANEVLDIKEDISQAMMPKTKTT